jgi:hypothetical protein
VNAESALSSADRALRLAEAKLQRALAEVS